MGKFGFVTVLVAVVLLAFVSTESAAAEFNQQVRMGRRLAHATTLQECLAQGGALTAFPGSSEYDDNARGVYNKRNLYAPVAFVFPTTVEQVQNAILCSKQVGVGIVPRCGGHSYEGYSLGGRDGVLVVDMVGFKQLSYNSAAKTAVVGAGWRLGPLYLALWNAGQVTIPAGTCPTVGVAGHALGGGVGFIARKFGLLSDNTLELQLVTANGTVVTCNANHNKDLYFALRGAGATSYGIVTQFTFRVIDVSIPVTRFSYAWTTKSLQFQNLKAFQIWGANVPAEISALLYMNPAGDSVLQGTYLGPKSSLPPLVQGFLSEAGPNPSTTVEQVDWIHSILMSAGYPVNTDPNTLDSVPLPTLTFKGKSTFVNAPGMSDQAINAMINATRAGNNDAYFLYELYGSQSVVNKVAPTASAFVHRGSFFSIQMVAYWSNASDAVGQMRYIKNCFNAVKPYATREAYQNNIDSDMPLRAYYGANLRALIQEKKKWDPQNVFNFPQSIPLKK